MAPGGKQELGSFISVLNLLVRVSQVISYVPGDKWQGIHL